MNITLEVLTDLSACISAKEVFLCEYSDASVPWQEVVLHPRCSVAWAVWLKCAIARCGSAEDRAALRGDWYAGVRYSVACYGSDEDRAALRNDPDTSVRSAVARYSSDEYR